MLWPIKGINDQGHLLPVIAVIHEPSAHPKDPGPTRGCRMSRICRVPTRPIKERPVADRLKDFDSAELVYEEKDALIEPRC